MISNHSRRAIEEEKGTCVAYIALTGLNECWLVKPSKVEKPPQELLTSPVDYLDHLIQDNKCCLERPSYQSFMIFNMNPDMSLTCKLANSTSVSTAL